MATVPKRPRISLEELKRSLGYDPETGRFWWVAPGVGRKMSRPPGSRHKDGSLIISLRQVKYRAARLAWLYVYGVWPEHDVDHIDGDNANNRISNLRDIPHQLNIQNQRRAHKGSKTGLLGVSPFRDGFVAFIKMKDGRQKKPWRL